jgi:energy-coupling factor transporter ATP-binding protein EcfA2
LTIIVWKNNAGKSTIAEGLRFISAATTRYKSSNYVNPPDWMPRSSDDKRVKCIYLSTKGIYFNFDKIFHHYGDPPAIISAKFTNKIDLNLYICGENSICTTIKNQHYDYIKSKSEANLISIPEVRILPQVGPLSKEEKILNPEYVKTYLHSYLSSQHFRNQINIFYKEYFNKFKLLSESTWQNLRILSLEGRDGLPDSVLALLVRDGNFVADVADMGHGLQMWLQTMWFIAISENAKVLIFDEPDVYLHADLQRKLIKMLKKLNKQIIITTHSLEIISEVDPDSLLIVDKKEKKSYFAKSRTKTQAFVDQIGSLQNIYWTKLWSSKKCILIEGKDIDILKHLYSCLYFDDDDNFDSIPNMQIGGWSGWNYAVGSNKFIKNTGDDRIKMYCLLDRDYHLDEEICQRIDEAKRIGIQLYIWKMKEIENYLIVPSAILRIIMNESKLNKLINIDIVKAAIDSIIEKMKDDVSDNFSSSFHDKDRRSGITNANKKARDFVNKNWGDEYSRMSLVSGKKVISKISFWSQDNYNVSLSGVKIAKNLSVDELNKDVKYFISTIKQTSLFY